MLRLLLIIILFLASLLTVFPAPTLLGWYLAILVTEFSWIFIIASIILLVWGFGVKGFYLAGTILVLVTICLFLRPIVGASRVSAHLDEELSQALGDHRPIDEGQPFIISRMITGINATQLPYRTLTYTPAGMQPLTLDYYAAQDTGLMPCVVFVHGGSWAGGDSRQLPELNSYLAKSGYNVVSINYRLAPQYKSPSQVDDLHTAIGFLKENALSLKIDTNKLVLLGRSAGGQIVLQAAYTFHDPGIKGVISYYGPADMVWGYQNPANKMVYNSCEVMERYFGGSYNAVPAQYEQASPILAVTPHSVPTLLIHGQLDVLVAYGHSTRLVAQLEKAHVQHYLLTLPWATHGCDYSINGPSGQLATYTVTRFLQHIFR